MMFSLRILLSSIRKKIFSGKPLFFLSLTFLFSLFLLFPNSAEASIRKTEEADGQTLYKSLHQLQDAQKQSWQVVLFKREKGDTEGDVKLRLVGFPNQAEIAHPAPLILETDRAAWQAEDLFADQSPAPNVGQYNLSPIISQLSQQETLILKIPETNHKEITLKVPGVIVLEWKIVAGEQ